MKATLVCFVLAVCAGVAVVGSSAAAGSPTDRWGTVWLCRPGIVSNPCTSNLTASVVAANGAARIEHASGPANPPVDCFYVYPTVSRQPTTNANLQIDPEERSVAVSQASRFSTACRVYAPMYPQLTLHAIFTPGGITAQSAAIAYGGVVSAFHNYLAHYNHGRGIVFIGHSQGASLLIALLRREVDPNPSLRRRLVSALLLGGNVTVARGKRTGGDFTHIPACEAAGETGCVVAYSSFDGAPAGQQQVRPCRTGGQPAAGLGHGGSADHVRQPGRGQRRERCAAALLHDQLGPGAARPRSAAAAGVDAMGVLSARVHRPLRIIRRRELAAGEP